MILTFFKLRNLLFQINNLLSLKKLIFLEHILGIKLGCQKIAVV
jgi:hypothetical protein